MVTGLYRRGLLAIADTPVVGDFVKRQRRDIGVGRFVAGEGLADAIEAAKGLEQQGMYGILDLLGEFIDNPDAAEAITQEILDSLATLAPQPIDKYMSVKPTQMGLAIDADMAFDNAVRIAEQAREAGAKVCLDMENSPYVEGTLQLFQRLHAAGYHHMSTVLQSYLKRSFDDLEALLSLEPRPSVRIVKGAYLEPASVAFKDKKQVDANYREMVYRGLEAGATIGVATHDESIIAETAAYLRGAALPKERCEFQLLYGVKPKLQRQLVEAGHLVRIYIPYGQDWYGYFSRRLAERPANFVFVLRGLMG